MKQKTITPLQVKWSVPKVKMIDIFTSFMMFWHLTDHFHHQSQFVYTDNIKEKIMF
jgi:hypothetical protein